MATTRVYKLYTAAVASTNAAAQVQIQQNGVITGILFSGFAIGGAAAGAMVYELSFQSTAQATTNDTVGPISNATLPVSTTAGGGLNQLVAALNIPVRAGDKLYVNTDQSGTAPATARTSIFLFVAQ